MVNGSMEAKTILSINDKVAKVLLYEDFCVGHIIRLKDVAEAKTPADCPFGYTMQFFYNKNEEIEKISVFDFVNGDEIFAYTPASFSTAFGKHFSDVEKTQLNKISGHSSVCKKYIPIIIALRLQEYCQIA